MRARGDAVDGAMVALQNIHFRTGAITSLIKGRLPGAASWQAPRTVGKRKGLISDQKHFHSQSFHFESSQVKSIQVKAAIWLSVVYV